MTSEEIAAQIRNAEIHAVRGDYQAAFEVFEAMVKSGVSDEFVFNVYRKFFNLLNGHDIPHAQIFNFIYASDQWEGGSGAGSRPDLTASYQAFLKEFIEQKNIRSVIDAGCGDWQFSRLMDWDGVEYLGIDVSSIVLSNTKRFAKGNIRFIEGDVRTMTLPEADLLIMKDVLQHWSNRDILSMIPKFERYRCCLIANGTTEQQKDLVNMKMQAGGFRPIDLTLPPFSVTGSYIFEYDVSYSTRAEGPVCGKVRVLLIERGKE